MYFIDFEYSQSKESNIDVVCAALIHGDKQETYWLWRNESNQDEFKKRMQKLEGETLVSYQAMAEVRSLISLGIDPKKYKWIDLYSEWMQLRNKNDKFLMADNGGLTDKGLTACAKHLLGIEIDKEHKETMRNLIMSQGPFNENDKADIVAYCLEDVVFLPSLLHKMFGYYLEEFDVVIRPVMEQRGEYIRSLGICEQEGIPLDVELLTKIVDNYNNIDKSICEKMNETFELFEFLSKFNKYKFNNKKFTAFIKSLRIVGWPKTPTGSLKTDDKTVQKFRIHKEIEDFHQCRKARGTLRYINPKTKDNIWDYIGEDNRLRPFYGPFGTQSGRNAAKAKSFIFAMSSWMRVLVKPIKGNVVTGIDWKSQEFGIGAALSHDANMIEAYQSGDPYLHFAKLAGAVPMDGERKDYKKERDLFKATVLGLSYGMGAQKLAAKLSADCGRKVSVGEATQLMNKHRRVFRDYWKYLGRLATDYSRNGLLYTSDNWLLFGDNDNTLSVKNFMIQATAASILRSAVSQLTNMGVKVIAPLHDCIYFEHKAYDKLTINKVSQIMKQCTEEFIDIEIGQDVESHGHDDQWIELKAEDDWARIKRYL